jgi:hypothetical protein
LSQIVALARVKEGLKRAQIKKETQDEEMKTAGMKGKSKLSKLYR